jgi:4-hydroxythreonine-4-phosphate dehydrogenase
MVLGISIGDPNGIGPEVVLKTFSDARMFDFCTPVVYARADFLESQSKHFGLKVPIQPLKDRPQRRTLNVVDCWKNNPEVEYGKETKSAGVYALESLTAATQSLKNGTIQALVTAPINKASIQSDHFAFPGHTDYLAQELGGNALMFMIHNQLRVGLLTDHVPISEVTKMLTTEHIVDKLKLMSQSLQKDFGIRKPKIAVLGINPHAGDHGVIGTEDDQILTPILSAEQIENTLLFGPFSADAFFGSQEFLKYDAVLAAYHDQGLIPFKTLSFGEGVNYTAGLSAVRTSPDHGTAFAIAGKGLADHHSFRQAVFAALDIVGKRQEFHQINANPLPLRDNKKK